MKVEKAYSHFLISYMRDYLERPKIKNDLLDEKKRGANIFGIKYFIFQDVAFGTEYVDSNIKVKGTYIGEGKGGLLELPGVDYMERWVDGEAEIDAWFINAVGEKYFNIGENMTSFLQAGLGFGGMVIQAKAKPTIKKWIGGKYSTEVLADNTSESLLSGVNFFVRYGMGYADRTLHLFAHISYTTKVSGEFETVGFMKGNASESDFREIDYMYPEIKYGGFGWGFSVGIKF